jgi:hypothetical protein
MMSKTQRMFALVEAWRAGEESKNDFCDRHQINVHTFSYWVGKYTRNHQDEGGFVELSTAASLPTARVRLTYPNGVILELEEATPEVIGRLIGLGSC